MAALVIKKIGRLLTTGWNFPRIFRFTMGMAALVFGIAGHDALLGGAGGILALMAIFNRGCCGGGSCNINSRGNC